ncbi:MAG: CDP-glycerol glycerophosphotransferase family protein [Eubacterium sp.]|nr:CDP-glycerol glycerophosphotransferase family protein [Eubacterium sp.]
MNRLKQLTKNNAKLRRIIRKIIFFLRRVRYNIRGIGVKTDEQLFLFSSFEGHNFADSPKAIYEYLKSSEEFADCRFVWCFEHPEKYRFLEENKNTRVVKQNSKECEICYKTAKYWILNHRVAVHRYPKKNQVFVQCWHGTPLKKLGFDIDSGDNVINTQKELCEKYLTDAKKYSYMLSPSPFATEKFISSFNLKAINKENCIIQQGYPRNDFLFRYGEEDISRIKESLSLPKNKKVILYAPTWRDNQHQTGVGYTYKIEVDFEKLQKELQNEYVILFRAHYFVSNSFDFEKYKGFVYNVSQIDDINELYIISDILITDYSSVFFDYANLKRPIIFFMYDIEQYKNELRGFYIDLKELPGSIVENEGDLIEEIKKSDNFTYSETYRKFNEKFNLLDDSNASKRVIDIITQKS